MERIYIEIHVRSATNPVASRHVQWTIGAHSVHTIANALQSVLRQFPDAPPESSNAAQI